MNILPSYTSMSNASVGNTIYIKMFYYIKSITNGWIWNTCVIWQGTDYRLLENETIVSKQVGPWKVVK